MNEIATGMFFWLLKILGAYLGILIVLTLALSRWKKKSSQETEEIAEQKKQQKNADLHIFLLGKRQWELFLCLITGLRRSRPASRGITGGSASHHIIQKCFQRTIQQWV